MTAPGVPPDAAFDVLLARVLRVGVWISAIVVCLGGSVFLARHGHEPTAFAVFRGEPAEFRSVPGIVRTAVTGGGRGLVQLGLLLLVATPVARVVFSIVGFARQRDWLYVVVTSLVLGLLAYSLFATS